jgi:hypothetical protein
MASDSASSSSTLVRLVTAALAFLDSDAAFGSSDDRTRWAKERLRRVVEDVVVADHEDGGDPPQLRVIRGSRAET